MTYAACLLKYPEQGDSTRLLGGEYTGELLIIWITPQIFDTIRNLSSTSTMRRLAKKIDTVNLRTSTEYHRQKGTVENINLCYLVPYISVFVFKSTGSTGKTLTLIFAGWLGDWTRPYNLPVGSSPTFPASSSSRRWGYWISLCNLLPVNSPQAASAYPSSLCSRRWDYWIRLCNLQPVSSPTASTASLFSLSPPLSLSAPGDEVTELSCVTCYL